MYHRITASAPSHRIFWLTGCLFACISVLMGSLALVGDVPEFREGKGKLAALEDRLQRRVEGRLGEALQV